VKCALFYTLEKALNIQASLSKEVVDYKLLRIFPLVLSVDQRSSAIVTQFNKEKIQIIYS